MFPLGDGQGGQTTTGSLDLVVFTEVAEGGFSRSPLLGSVIPGVCSEIPGAEASSLMVVNILSDGWRYPSLPGHSSPHPGTLDT